MPYPRYARQEPTNRRDPGFAAAQGYTTSGVNPWGGMNRGLLPTPSAAPPPSGGGGGAQRGGLEQLALAGNLIGSLLNSGNVPMTNLANQLAVAQAFQKPNPLMGGGNVPGGMRGAPMGNRDMMRRNRRDSPVRSSRNTFRRRSRSRSPRNNQRRLSDRGNSGRRNDKRGHEDDQQRPEHEIYIGNYPLKFREGDLRKLFAKHNVIVKTIRMKHDGQKVFAFAETTNKGEILKAIKAIDSKEINGRRLRVRAAGDKDPPAKKDNKPMKKELTTDHVTRHLVYAFISFLERQCNTEDRTEEVKDQINGAIELMRSAFEIEENDDSLKVSRNLELIFMQNNRREIKPPQDTISMEESKIEDEEQKEEESGNAAKKRKIDDEDEQDEKEEEDAEDVDEIPEVEAIELEPVDDEEENETEEKDDDNTEEESLNNQDEDKQNVEDDVHAVEDEAVSEEQEEKEEDEDDPGDKEETAIEEKEEETIEKEEEVAPVEVSPTRSLRGRNKARRGKK